MRSRSHPYLIEKLPLAAGLTLLDVGGGLGSFSRAFCRHYPQLRATLVEHPHVAPLARRAIRDSGMAKKVQIIGAGFITRCSSRIRHCLVSNVLHAHGVAVNQSLLTKLHHCLNPQGHLILRDVFMSREDRSRVGDALFGRCCFCTHHKDAATLWTRFSDGCAKPAFSRITGPSAPARFRLIPIRS